MPEIPEVFVCAAEPGATDKTIKTAILKESNIRTEKRMRSLLSRLAREVKVVRVSGIVSGFRGCGLRRSPGSAELRRAAFPPRKFRAVARAEFLPPYSRAAATVLHRLPGTESAANVAER